MTRPDTSRSAGPAFQGAPLGRDVGDSHQFNAQSIKLANANATTKRNYDARGMDLACVRIETSNWAGAAVVLEGSLDDANWTEIATLNEETPERTAMGVSEFPLLRLRVATNAGGAASAIAQVYIYKASSSADFFVDVAEGKVPGHSIFHQFGRNPNVANGVFSMISLLGLDGLTYFTQAPTTMRLAGGGNAADDAAGTGAREVTIIGVDSNLNEVTETIVTTGALASAPTTASFWRVYLMFVSASGTYGQANAGDMQLEPSSGGQGIISMLAGIGRSAQGAYTIPQGKQGFLLSMFISVESNKPAAIQAFSRDRFNDVTAPFGAPRVRAFFDGIEGFRFWKPRAQPLLQPLTDFWFEGSGTTAQTAMSINFELLLIDI